MPLCIQININIYNIASTIVLIVLLLFQFLCIFPVRGKRAYSISSIPSCCQLTEIKNLNPQKLAWL